ncbi:MAG: acetyl-CoA hydrolase/transferase C-terminal domain-containing protein [Syntrophorhabdaceae bacterium]|nr:acetyl-CoA hydrolase/transferase C-terminal domain-containing protein [Syntrophorhabdaceae bacterium]MDD5243679.1 acetyl-CoA hydrolase/transferase C-terminal domain-containing protein [Syntrophorhabdaceae bacterium]
MYEHEYQKKLVAPEKAIAAIRDGDMLVHGLALAEPPALLRAIADRLRAGDLKRIKVFSSLPLKHACDTILAVDLMDCVDAYSQFVSSGERGLVSTGLASFVPNHLHQMPRLLTEFIGVDVCVTMVSPVDQSGYFSFGTANDFTSTAARAARVLIVEVNRFMPRVFGDSSIHISEVDAIVENHEPIFTPLNPESRSEDEIIGKAIAEMVPDGACLQLGIGALPNAVAAYLEGHKDLGIHTEVFGPAMVNLIKKGVITGSKKTLHPRKHVFTVALGDQEMLDFMDNNPAMKSYPCSYTNHPSVIAQNARMVSINAVLEVDLTGQCNAEFLYGHQFSGTGGQLDFVRGAFDAKEGKSILAFYSTADHGKTSRIVDCLEQGATITTPRTDTHYLITEYGTANLKGKSTKERALAIIELAHPEFREELLRKAEEMYLI